ncbi:hypothetical protein Zmor_001230 [Zophobas morio]|uniref:Uncharacterized protein n=1 Tax=Zophobas morio TaxID=2755281 RepID=A0AA38MRR2_9CUCU|nr:hypothetical protein Zmor_001230 [Zophobas morio]
MTKCFHDDNPQIRAKSARKIPRFRSQRPFRFSRAKSGDLRTVAAGDRLLLTANKQLPGGKVQNKAVTEALQPKEIRQKANYTLRQLHSIHNYTTMVVRHNKTLICAQIQQNVRIGISVIERGHTRPVQPYPFVRYSKTRTNFTQKP